MADDNPRVLLVDDDKDLLQLIAMRLSATGYAEYEPKDSNDTEEGRRRNRRIEILLGPPVRAGSAEGP